MSFMFEISFSEEQEQYLNNTPSLDNKYIEHNTKKCLQTETMLLQQTSLSFSFISNQTNLYKSLYDEKCNELLNMEKEFETLHESVSKMLDDAKEVKHSLEIQVKKLKEFSAFIFDLYKNKQFQSLDYVMNFISQNNTIFTLNNNNINNSINTNRKNLSQMFNDIDNQKDYIQKETIINFDENFWETNEDSNYCLTNKRNNNTCNKYLNVNNFNEQILLDKVNSFLIGL